MARVHPAPAEDLSEKTTVPMVDLGKTRNKNETVSLTPHSLSVKARERSLSTRRRLPTKTSNHRSHLDSFSDESVKTQRQRTKSISLDVQVPLATGSSQEETHRLPDPTTAMALTRTPSRKHKDDLAENLLESFSDAAAVAFSVPGRGFKMADTAILKYLEGLSGEEDRVDFTARRRPTRPIADAAVDGATRNRALANLAAGTARSAARRFGDNGARSSFRAGTARFTASSPIAPHAQNATEK